MDSQPLTLSSAYQKSALQGRDRKNEKSQFQFHQVKANQTGDTSLLHGGAIQSSEGARKPRQQLRKPRQAEKAITSSPTQAPTTTEQSRGSKLQDGLIAFLNVKAGLDKDQFSKHITTITKHSLNDIHQLIGGYPRDNSLRKRIILGDALNAFNREINKAFFNTWYYAKDLLNKDPKVLPPVVSNIMVTVMNDLYKTLSTQRLQLFIAAGYLDKDQLDSDELARFEPIIDDQGQEIFCPDNLHNVLRHHSRTAKSGQLNNFLSDYAHCLATEPTTLHRCIDTPSEPPAKAAECTPVADKLLLLSLFHLEKERFIADVQRLYLHNAEHFDDQALPHETASEQLWRPSGFSAPLTDPGHYRSAFPPPKQASLPGPPAPALSVAARQVTNAFSTTAHKIIRQTRKNTEQSSTKSQSVHKRVLLGDALNSLHSQFDQQFLNAFNRAHRGLPAIDEQPSSPLTTEDLVPVFQQMFSTLADLRTQLFVDAGYLETDRLSTIEILKLKGGRVDEDGQTLFFPTHLIRLIKDAIGIFDPQDPFDVFLRDFATTTIKSVKFHLLRDPEAYLRTDTLHGTQQLAHILAKDKTFFIDTIQALQLRDNGRFNDELSLEENHLSELFAPDTFLDIVKNPDAYRTASGHIPTCWPAARQNGVTTTAIHSGIDRAHAVSAATRLRGTLDYLKEGLAKLFSAAIDNDSHPDAAAYSRHFDHTGNLLLATLLSTRLHDRQLSIQRQLVMPGQDPLSQSPAMRLLTYSQAISARLQVEANAFINQLKTNDEPISAYWNQDDLVNIAILQSTAETSGAVTECFLYEVLHSPHLGIEHEQPENVFAADGRVRGSNDQHIFHNPATGKTTPGGTAGALARIMLQAMARQQLAGNSQINLPDSLCGKIIQQVSELYHRREITAASVLIPGYGHAQPSAEEITEIIHKRLIGEKQLVSSIAQFDPVLGGILNRGQFANGRKLFMQLTPTHQMESVLLLAVMPDYLGMGLPVAHLKKLQTDVLHHDIESDWQLFAYGEQAWELLTNLYDRKIAAPEEAINRMNVQTMINRHGINDAGEAMQLRQLLVQLLPRRTSASNFTSATQQTGLQPPVKLHQFEPGRIASMISDYQTVWKYLDQHFFDNIFGNTITDPQLRSEVISTVARITLDACKGSIASEIWQRIAVDLLVMEHSEFIRTD